MDKASQDLDWLIAKTLERQELSSLGHRIVYNKITGMSMNLYGLYCHPSKLDESGYQTKR